MPARCAALLVSAPASGQGKTTVTAALARLLVRRGLRVRVFKLGPDFLDPFWHQLASGHAVHNLDLWMTGEADVRARLHAAAQAADVLLVEGVMGLHDSTPSAAELARRFGLPVAVVVQVGRMAQTLGAVVHGLRHYREPAHGPLPWAGVLANGAASEGHARLLREAIDPPEAWLGQLPHSAAMHLPERHLGLVAAHELGQAEALARLDACADLLADTPLGRMDLADWRARWSVDFVPPAAPPALAAAPANGPAPAKVARAVTPAAALANPSPAGAQPAAFAPGAPAGASAASPAVPLAGRTIAVARDAAFAFIYPANLDVLRALGAELVCFSPLAGDALPPCDALWLPGGYPELHAAALAARTDLRAALHAHVAAGRPIWAECGGMMALFDHLTTVDGQTHALWGLLPGRAAMQKRLAGLGLQQWAGPWPAAAAGAPPLRGHSFHYAACSSPLVPVATTQPAPGSARAQGEAVWAHGPVCASFFHAWFASSPLAAASLFSNDFGQWPAPDMRKQL